MITGFAGSVISIILRQLFRPSVFESAINAFPSDTATPKETQPEVSTEPMIKGFTGSVISIIDKPPPFTINAFPSDTATS